MDFVFDCFFEEVIESHERGGLKTRQNRQNVIDQLDSIISGCSAGQLLWKIGALREFKKVFFFCCHKKTGQNVSHEEASCAAIEAAIKYHQSIKFENSQVESGDGNFLSLSPFSLFTHTSHFITRSLARLNCQRLTDASYTISFIFIASDRGNKKQKRNESL